MYRKVYPIDWHIPPDWTLETPSLRGWFRALWRWLLKR